MISHIIVLLMLSGTPPLPPCSDTDSTTYKDMEMQDELDQAQGGWTPEDINNPLWTIVNSTDAPDLPLFHCWADKDEQWHCGEVVGTSGMTEISR